MRIRGEYPTPIDQTVSVDTEVSFQQRLNVLLSVPGLKLKRIVSLLDAEPYLMEERTRGGLVFRFDVKRYAQDQCRTGRSVRLPDVYRPTSDVLLPPGSGEIQAGEGREPYREPEIIHRTKAVMDLLGEMDEPYELIDGTTTREMVRQLSYVAFVLKERKKLLLVNDEEGNATYVIHRVEIGDVGAYVNRSKDELRKLEREDPGLVSVLEFRAGMDAYVEEMRRLIEQTAETVPQPLLAEQNRVEDTMIGERRDVSDKRQEDDRIKERPPQGWLTLHGLERASGKSSLWVLARITQLAPTEGEDVRMFMKDIGHVFQYYSPKVVDRLKEMALAQRKAPKSWMTASGIATHLHRTDSWVQSRLSEQDLVTGQDVETFLDRGGHELPHYAPEIIRHLETLASRHERAPDGWETAYSMRVSSRRSAQWLKKQLKEFAIVEDRDTGTFLNQTGHPITYYSPEIVRRVREMTESHEEAPEGWLTMAGLSHQLQKTEAWVRRRLQELAPAQGRGVRSFQNAKRYVYTYYSPNVVRQMREMAQIHTPAPDGWLTMIMLSRILGKSDTWITKRLHGLHLVEGLDREVFLNVKKRPVPFYGPRIVEQLRRLADVEHDD